MHHHHTYYGDKIFQIFSDCQRKKRKSFQKNVPQDLKQNLKFAHFFSRHQNNKMMGGGRPMGPGPMAMPMNMAAMAAARPGMPPNAVNPAGMRPNFKYTSGVRNVAGAPVMPAQPAQAPMPPQQPQQQQPPQAAVFIQGQEPLTASMLAQAPPSEQKQMLGERLFPLIQSMFPDLAGKITGMLLEIDNSELVHMLEHKESLTSKVRN